MQHELDAYLTQCAQHRLRPRSVAVYRNSLEQLSAALRHNGVTTWAALDAAAFQQVFARQQRSRRLATQQHWLSVCRGFFAYLIAQGQLSSDPSAGLQPAVFTEELPADTTFAAARDRALWALSWLTRWDVHDILTLPLTALALEEQPPCVRPVFAAACVLSPEAVHALHTWLNWRLALKSGSPLLFIDRNGEALNLQWTQQKLRRLRQQHYMQQALTVPESAEPFNPQCASGSLDFKALAYVYARAHPRARRASVLAASSDEDSHS